MVEPVNKNKSNLEDSSKVKGSLPIIHIDSLRQTTESHEINEAFGQEARFQKLSMLRELASRK